MSQTRGAQLHAALWLGNLNKRDHWEKSRLRWYGNMNVDVQEMWTGLKLLWIRTTGRPL
jgi:hypothetical protein